MFDKLIWIVLGYLIGSIPWGLVIGKTFFQTDIREYGSGNLGGTNAGRVLGLHVGYLVILLDGLKAFLMMFLCHLLRNEYELLCGVSVCIGHCFPVFAQFKGGKAVACSYGFLLGLACFIHHEFIITFLLPILVFFTVLYLSKYVSLSSMCGVLSGGIMIFLFVNRKTGLIVLALALFVIYRHRSNIQRILQGKESRIGQK
ncbi:MAG: glycerol-3-phosphate 1-O-acyltransferase PlsY [Erysipelotrichaceae bacterium]|nr:glycerol-3-phosphate 1-O-acyltransferase PlsY [Erysipelotrichaceae bacterium]